MATMPIARLAIVALLFFLGACGDDSGAGPPAIDVIGKPRELTEPLRNAERPTGQVMLGATAQGLVTFDATGDIIGALAERWIVEDDGQSYIFRLKRANWTDGKPVKAAEVARLLLARMAAHPHLLAGMRPQVTGMTDEVIEIRLGAPLPSFLQLLAQPAMAIARPGGGTGPLRKERAGDGYILLAATDAAEAEARESDTDSDDVSPMPIHVRAVGAALAFARFNAERTDLVLGGRFQHLPLVAVANLPANAVRVDPVNGLFGLLVEGSSDFLENRDVREAINMAIDRNRIAQRLNVSGWRAATNILPAPIDLDRAPTETRWAERPIALRRGYARSVVSNWRATRDDPPRLRIALPAGAGATTLYGALAQDLAAIGLTARPVRWDAPADLRLIDEVAPFDSALWYLARIGCAHNRLCSIDAEARLDHARKADAAADRAIALGEAEVLALAESNFIPLGQPVRFALVSPRLTGYAPSPRARHPLNALFRAPR